MRFATRVTLCLGLALGLVACSSKNSTGDNFAIAKQVAKQAFTPRKQTTELAGVSPEQITQVLAGRPDPLALVALEKVQTQGLFLRISKNGEYGTYATANRHAVIFRNGIATATRGLGGDLMSSKTTALETVLMRRTAAAGVPYEMEFLNGEDQTFRLSLTCDVTPGAQTRVTGGEVDAEVIQITALCKGADGVSFTNIYMVDAQGRILAARQWMGDFIEYVSIQHLRV